LWGRPFLRMRPQPRHNAVPIFGAAGDAGNELDRLVCWAQPEPVAGALQEKPRGLQAGPFVPIMEDLVSSDPIEVEGGHLPDGRWLALEADAGLDETDKRLQARQIDNVLFPSQVKPTRRPNHPLVNDLQLFGRQVSHRLANASQTVRYSFRLRSRLRR